MATNPVRIPISAEDRFSKTFGKAQKGLIAVGAAAAKTATKVAKIGAAFAAAGVTAGVALTKASMTSIDALAKTADRIGVTTESLASLQLAASLAGVESRTLEKSLQNLAVGVSDAADGTGVAKDALIELGLSAASLEKLPLDQQMYLVADAMKDVENQTDKVRIATDLFGARGVAVLNMIGDGSSSLRQMAEESEKLGLAISRVDAKQIEMANDAVTTARSVFTGLGNQLATAFSPIIYGIATGFRQSALDTEDFGSIGQKVARAVVEAFGSILNVVNDIKLAFVTVKSLGLEALLLFQKVQEAIAGPLDRSNVNELRKQIQAVEMQMHLGKIGAIEARQEIDKLTEAYRSGNLVAKDNEFAKAIEETKSQLETVNAEMLKLMTNPPPADALMARFEEIQAGMRRTAETMVGTTATMTDAEDKSGNATLKKMTFVQEQAIAGRKKYDEFILKSTTAQTSHVLGELSNQFSGIAQNNKKLFALNKAFQIAQAIMQTYQGATLALSSYPPPLSFAMAAAQVASGLGQVAQIKAQSFDGGGFTGFGARSGGMDGKGGFPAILHPNETVVDHTKGQGQGITIVNNVDARGSGPEVDIKIQQAMQVTSQQTIATIQDLMRRRRFA